MIKLLSLITVLIAAILNALEIWIFHIAAFYFIFWQNEFWKGIACYAIHEILCLNFVLIKRQIKDE